ncbi:hypothetical protein ES319_D12G275000v1 [Gossypium barbadense]|uniref:Uncharacterized protein n=1 Tax=Gossypium barbadense TaxID=3634 RepID=A0A5J5P3N8_GOSBA|nr:hypothetical protein ES319_D12G275000v1 [Gossypium barbadense]
MDIDICILNLSYQYKSTASLAHYSTYSFNKISAMAAAPWFKTFLLVSLLLLMPFSQGMVEEGLDGGMKQAADYSVEQGGKEMMMIQMRTVRKLMMLGGMQDYDDTGANQKHEHDPRKKPGKP